MDRAVREQTRPASARPDGPTAKHWLGVDLAGKDVLTSILYAGQISLKIGLFTSRHLHRRRGTSWAPFAGYFGGWLDQVLMRLTDLFLLLPALVVLAIALQKFGRATGESSSMLAGLGWMGIARIVRGQVLQLEGEGVRRGGSGDRRRHRFASSSATSCRTSSAPIMVNASLAVAGAIIAESTLSFLGFGVQPPKTSWGKMLADGKEVHRTPRPYLIYFPGLFIILVTLAVNFLGDGLRDAFDPQAKKH